MQVFDDCEITPLCPRYQLHRLFCSLLLLVALSLRSLHEYLTIQYCFTENKNIVPVECKSLLDIPNDSIF